MAEIGNGNLRPRLEETAPAKRLIPDLPTWTLRYVHSSPAAPQHGPDARERHDMAKISKRMPNRDDPREMLQARRML